MAYQAIYRKFRPKTFDEVLGQEHVTTILKNQIVSGNIAHAYLFSGTRGTGKTSTAKIFARAVNCLEKEYGNPCNECEICKGILSDSIMDVIEMDAASNNSVDDIRELRDKVRYLPSKGKYKVYIIDEVHMLSKGAFNALLKTLEEPPEHLLFILATTEPHKLPATILSRCQRFDFKRITIDDIIINMKSICERIGVQIEDKGLKLIAKNSDGAMRDALSILDQCISFSDGVITYDYILSILGIVNNDIVFDMVDSIISRDINKALELIDYIVRNGKDINQFIKDLIEHFRNLMISKISKTDDSIIEGSKDIIERFDMQSQKISLDDIIRFISILSDTEAYAKQSSQPRIIMETSIVKLIRPSSELTIEGLAERISELENRFNKSKSQEPYNKKEKKIQNKIENETKHTSVSEVKKEKHIEKQHINEHAEIKNVDISDIQNAWPEILKKIKKQKINIHALLIEGRPLDKKSNVLIIAYEEPYGFHKEAVDKENNKKYIENIINNYLNTNIKIKFLMQGDTGKSEEDKDDERQELIDEAVSLFGKDIIEIKD